MVNESVTYTLWHFDKKVFFYSQAQDGQTLRWSVEIKGLFPPNELFVALHPPSKAFAVFQDIYPAEKAKVFILNMETGKSLEKPLEHKPMTSFSHLVCGGICISKTAVAALLVEHYRENTAHKSELVVWDRMSGKVIHNRWYTCYNAIFLFRDDWLVAMTRRDNKLSWTFIDKAKGEYKNTLHIMNIPNSDQDYITTYELDLVFNSDRNRMGNRWGFRADIPHNLGVQIHQNAKDPVWSRDNIIKAVIGSTIVDDGSSWLPSEGVLECWIAIDVSKLLEFWRKDSENGERAELMTADTNETERCDYAEFEWKSDDSGIFWPSGDITRHHPTRKARWSWVHRFSRRE